MEPGRPLIGITCGTPSADEASRYGTNQSYVRALQAAGAAVVMVPPGPVETANSLLARLDALLLPGGADVDPRFYGAAPSEKLGETDPERDRFELALLAVAAERGTRVMAICRGMQVVNVAFGGTLYQDLATERPSAVAHRTPREEGRGVIAHEVEVVAGSWLAGAAGSARLRVNSLHHQAVRDVGRGLEVTARSPDGIVEGLETPDRRVVAMQCHPEELPGLAWARGTFESFVGELAGDRR